MTDAGASFIGREPSGGLVTYSLEASVATVRMDDGKANALSIAMLDELHAVLDRAEADEAVVVLAGREGRFSAGFHLPTLRARGQEARRMVRSAFDLAVRLLAFPRPVVIACTGHAYAMGAFLLTAADHRVGAAGPYTITANETLLGIVMPRSAIELCRQRIATPYLHRTLVLAEAYSPEVAVRAGFLDELAAPGAVLEVALDIARRAVDLDRSAYSASKARVQAETLVRLRSSIDDEYPDELGLK